MSMIQGSAEWHEARRQGIGGSDVAAVLNLSRYKSSYQLYREKIGVAEAQDETWEMARGKALEPLLRQHYANTTGRRVLVPAEALVHPDYPFMRYNPDGISEDGSRLQEFKTAAYGKEWGEAGSDEIPQEYLLQVQHGMFITKCPVTDVTVSIAGNQPKYFEVERDRELQEMIKDSCADFWGKVQRREAPAPVTNDDVATAYKKVNGFPKFATEEVLESLARLKVIRTQIKEAEAAKEVEEVIIKNFLGEFDTLLPPVGITPLITWKQQNGARRIDADALRKSYPDIAATVTKQDAPLRRLLIK